MEWIAFLLVAGLILVVVEVFLPGGVFGFVGGCCLICAIVMSYLQYGVAVGSWVLGGVIVATLVGLILWTRYFPMSPLGRRMMLDATSGKTTPEQNYQSYVGKSGVARSLLRPAGIADIEGHRLDVMSEGALISPGSQVQVIAVDGTKIVVRQV